MIPEDYLDKGKNFLGIRILNRD